MLASLWCTNCSNDGFPPFTLMVIQARRPLFLNSNNDNNNNIIIFLKCRRIKSIGAYVCRRHGRHWYAHNTQPKGELAISSFSNVGGCHAWQGPGWPVIQWIM